MKLVDFLILRADVSANAATVKERALIRLEDVERKIRQLAHIRAALREVLEACPGSDSLGCCSIMKGLERATRENRSTDGGP